MRFFSLLRYDLGPNMLKKPVKWIVMLLLALFFCGMFSLDAFHYFWQGYSLQENLRAFSQHRLSIGDMFAYMMGGILPVDMESLTDSFQFPIRWLLPHVLILYITLPYAVADISKQGLQILIRTGKKTYWWLSKCIWNMVTVATCCLVYDGVICLFAILTGKSKDVILNAEFFEKEFNAVLLNQQISAEEFVVAFLLMPMLVCMSMSLLQMLITLFIHPICAYCIVLGYYIVGAYYVSPVFISNYAMGTRNAVMGAYNFTSMTGVCLCGSVIFLCISLGMTRIRQMDFLQKESM